MWCNKLRWWTEEEDKQLKDLVDLHGARNWKKIASFFEDRSDVQCLHRWQKVLNPELVKGPWTIEEDQTLLRLVKQYGAKNWSHIAKHLPGRIGKQCRERLFFVIIMMVGFITIWILRSPRINGLMRRIKLSQRLIRGIFVIQ